MAISAALIRQAVESLSEVDGLSMDTAALVEDAVLLSAAFPEEEDYMAACASTRRAFEQLIAGQVISSGLKYDFSGWKSYHYQHRVGQGIKAGCRVMYRETENGIEVNDSATAARLRTSTSAWARSTGGFRSALPHRGGRTSNCGKLIENHERE